MPTTDWPDCNLEIETRLGFFLRLALRYPWMTAHCTTDHLKGGVSESDTDTITSTLHLSRFFLVHSKQSFTIRGIFIDVEKKEFFPDLQPI